MKKNKFYVTSSIVYVNSKPHLGFTMELLQADTLARYYKSKGYDSFFLTGTDEHGQKIYDSAKENNQAPQDYVNNIAQSYIDLTKLLKIKNDGFVRTTNIEHKEAAQKLWLACSKDIYKGQYEGMYCVGCERYYSESEMIKGCCPVHKKTLKKLKIDSYFFRLSKYQKKLESLIANREMKIIPAKRRNEMLSFIKQGLEDVSISRPKSELDWGVEVPGDKDHVMYVWFDALSNYISAIGYQKNTKKFNKYWPADMHVVGKDIARFHCVLWPAMLFSAGLLPPKAVYVHPFINSVGHKMSKSLGNVIDPVATIKRFGLEPVRYYLLRYIPYDNDGDFTNERLINIYNSDLADNLGNLVARVSAMLNKYNQGKFDKQAKTKNIEGLEDLIVGCKFNLYFDQIFTRLDELNKAIEENKPWELHKEDPKKAVAVLSGLTNEILQIAAAIKPFLPDTAEKICKIFSEGKVDNTVGILFPRIENAS